MKIVIKANNKDELELGQVHDHPALRRRAGLRLEEMSQWRKEMIADHGDLLNAVRNRTQAIPSARDWAKSLLYKLEVEITDAIADRFVNGLDAVYTYDTWLWAQTKGNYDFSKNGSDLIDSMQLFYLSDTRVHFLTQDKKIKRRVENSNQSNRILDWDDFIRGI
jgi:hypothetical protein